MDYEIGLCLNTTKFLISYALHMLLKQGSLFHSRPHYIMRSFIP